MKFFSFHFDIHCSTSDEMVLTAFCCIRNPSHLIPGVDSAMLNRLCTNFFKPFAVYCTFYLCTKAVFNVEQTGHGCRKNLPSLHLERKWNRVNQWTLHIASPTGQIDAYLYQLNCLNLFFLLCKDTIIHFCAVWFESDVQNQDVSSTLLWTRKSRDDGNEMKIMETENM